MSILSKTEILRELKGAVCQCGNTKMPRDTFCRACYYNLNAELQKALYLRFGQGYEAAYHKARSELDPTYEWEPVGDERSIHGDPLEDIKKAADFIEQRSEEITIKTYPAFDAATQDIMAKTHEPAPADPAVFPGVSSSCNFEDIPDMDWDDEEEIVVSTFPKPQRWTSEAYREFVMEHDCADCGKPGSPDLDIICAHVSLKNTGVGTKPPDWSSYPLCAICHSNEHAGHGMEEIDKLRVMVRLMGEWIEEVGDFYEDDDCEEDEDE